MPRKTKAYRRGFTLLEVNLAVFVMSTGILTICALYSLGFRENRQSVEDVAGAAWAEMYLSPLVQGLSATNMTWSAWKWIGGHGYEGVWPSGGWLEYIQSKKGSIEGGAVRYRVIGSPRGKADEVWNSVNERIQPPYNGLRPDIPDEYEYALVVTRRGSVVKLAFRCARRRETLMTQPAYVTEVRFCGNPDL